MRAWIIIVATFSLLAAGARAQTVRGGVVRVWSYSPKSRRCLLAFTRAEMRKMINAGRASGRATSRRLLEANAWELRYRDGGVIRWFAEEKDCERFGRHLEGAATGR